MSAKRQLRRRGAEDEPRFVIGMDAHSKKLAISIRDWSDRFNPCLHREIKCMDIEAMVATYERHVYRGTSKEVTRISNRIWSVCSRKGYKLPIRGGKAKTAKRMEMLKGAF